MAKLFYQNGNLITLKNHGCYQSVFLTNNYIFAQSSTDSTQQLKLFAIDTKKSILCAHASLAREEYAYTAFGHSAKLPSTRTLQGFNGEFLNELLGAYQLGLGFRTFSPGLMRFQSPDNLSPFGKGGVNSYAYCSGDPVNYTDPTGHALVHLKNGQTLRVDKNSAVALPHKFKSSTLKRTTSHASALNSNSPKYARPPEDHFKRIGEPDIFESIISNLTFNDAAAFAKTSQSNRSYAVPIIERYMSKIGDTDASMGAARAGVLPGVPRMFGQSLDLQLNPYLQDINSLRSIDVASLGGIRNMARLIRHNREYDARRNLMRSDSIDSLLGE